LLVGVFKHGYGRFVDIAGDEQLCFSGFLANSLQQLKEEEESADFLEEMDDPDDIAARESSRSTKSAAKGILEAPILNKLLLWILDEEGQVRVQRTKVKECDMDGHALQTRLLEREHNKKSCLIFTPKEKKEIFQWGRKIGAPGAARHYEREGRVHEFKALSWALIGKLMRSARTGEELMAYFEEKVLPYCRKLVALQAPTVVDPNKPLVNLTKKRQHQIGSIFIDCGAPMEDNSPIMIDLAANLLKRTAIYRQACTILVEHHEALGTALRGEILRRDLGRLPVWWCPWIHDYAMILGINIYIYIYISIYIFVYLYLLHLPYWLLPSFILFLL
jgi:hypothetical protein